ncbi:MAG: TatD family hydrolase [Labilithrix sp.]|nr:TatD family hydrolase [Labilithrix sp.]
MAADLVDTHCHLDAPELLEDADDLVERARGAGIRWIITIGAGRGTDSAPAAVALAHTHEEIAACVGIHPNDAECATETVMTTLAALSEDPRVVGIGETGLDYRHAPPPDAQRLAFRRSIQLARHVRKPLVIHTRAAAAETLAILRQEQAEDVGGVVHSCTDDVASAKAFLDRNFDISFSPLLLGYEHARDLARCVPLDRMLIETSAPYHQPAGTKHDLGTCLPLVAQHVADLIGASVEDVLARTSANAVRRFGLDELPEASRRSVF